MIPAEVQPADLNPVLGDLERRDSDALLGDRENPARTKRRYAFCSRFPLMCRVTRNDLRPVLRGVVFRIVDRH
ncbi:hypothetical protein D3C80_1880270 [compost metagenome]